MKVYSESEDLLDILFKNNKYLLLYYGTRILETPELEN
jgi:hypothetical protein